MKTVLHTKWFDIDVNVCWTSFIFGFEWDSAKNIFWELKVYIGPFLIIFSAPLEDDH